MIKIYLLPLTLRPRKIWLPAVATPTCLKIYAAWALLVYLLLNIWLLLRLYR